MTEKCLHFSKHRVVLPGSYPRGFGIQNITWLGEGSYSLDYLFYCKNF